jgi:hypothetical protein
LGAPFVVAEEKGDVVDLQACAPRIQKPVEGLQSRE